MKKKIFTSIFTPTRILAAAIVTTILFGSCARSKYRRTFAARPDTLCIDSAAFAYADSSKGYRTIVRIRVDYPTPITGRLSANIAAWIRQNLGTGTPSDTMSAQSVADFYGNAKLRAMGGIENTGKNKSYYADSRIICNRRDYVSLTFTTREQSELTGTTTYMSGATFRKHDGKRCGWDMLTDTSSNKLHHIMREGVRHYVEKEFGKQHLNNDNLLSLLQAGAENFKESDKKAILNKMPLPKSEPYLSKKGMTFVYQPYELAPVSLGVPLFTVPYEIIKPLMTKDAQEMFEKKHKQS